MGQSIFCLLQYIEDNLCVMSVGFLLSGPDDAVIWRGPKKNGENLNAFSLEYYCFQFNWKVLWTFKKSF